HAAADEPHDQQPQSRQACRECREEPSHRCPVRRYKDGRNPDEPRKSSARTLFRVDELSAQTSMMPRLIPIIAPWVRSLAPSFERMFFTRPLTVSSVIES